MSKEREEEEEPGAMAHPVLPPVQLDWSAEEEDSPDLSPEEEAEVEQDRTSAVLTPPDDPDDPPEAILSDKQRFVKKVIQGKSEMNMAQQVILAAQELAAADLANRYSAATSSSSWPTTALAAERLAVATAQVEALMTPPAIPHAVPAALINLMNDEGTAMPAMAVPAMAAAAAANPQDQGDRQPVIDDGEDRCSRNTNTTITRKKKTVKQTAKVKFSMVGSPAHLAAVAKEKAAAAAARSSSSSHATAQSTAAASASAGDRIK